MLILNMTTVFQNFSPIMPIYGILLPNLMFFCCARVLYLNKFESADVKYDNNFFKILIQKFPRKAFLVPNFRIVFFFFCSIFFMKLCLATNSRLLISNITIVFQIKPKNTFFFSQIFVFAQIRECWFQIWQKFFRILI